MPMCDLVALNVPISDDSSAELTTCLDSKKLRAEEQHSTPVLQFDLSKQITSSLAHRLHDPRRNKIIVPIDPHQSPTIDAVLNRVPLVYDPITKQLHFQNDAAELDNGKRTLNNGLVNLNHVTTQMDASDVSCGIQTSLNNSVNKVAKLTNGFCGINQSTAETVQSPQKVSTKESQDNKKQSSVVDESSGSTDDVASSCQSRDDDLSLNLSSLHFDDCDSISSTSESAKSKRSFPLSIQSLINKVKRKNGVSSNGLTVAYSTRGLILENRPSHLPAKSEEEEKKHKLEYEEMMKEARKKEAKNEKMQKKLIQKQYKQEELVIGAIKQWTSEILPNWERLKNSKKIKEIWWKGIPSRVREEVWYLAIGNELNITAELYHICVSRSKEKIWTTKISTKEKCESEDVESAADLIKLDVSRTFPQLGLFQQNGPYHDILRTVLGAYVTYRPDIGYLQGMSFLAAMLLLNMEDVQAFVCFANLLNNQLLLSFYRVDQTIMTGYYQSYQEFFKENLPKLFKHFEEHNLTPDLYLVDYIYTLFSRSLPLDVASRIWDMFLRDGDEFIFRAALGILSLYQETLLNLDFIHLAQFLTKLPDDIDSDDLFNSIANIKMVIGNDKMTFSSVLLTKLNKSA